MSISFCKCPCQACKSQPEGVGHIDLPGGREKITLVDSFGTRQELYIPLAATDRLERIALKKVQMGQREAQVAANLTTMGIDPDTVRKTPAGCGCGS